MSKIIKMLSIAIVLVFVVSLIGCSKPSSDNTSASAKDESQENQEAAQQKETEKKEIKKLSMIVFTDWYKDGWEAVNKNILENAEKLGFTIEFEKLVGGDQGEQLVKARFATGDMPDMINWYSVQDAKTKFGKMDYFVPVDGEWTGNYNSDMLKSGNYSFEGKVYGAPNRATSLGVTYYNKKIFNDLNLSIPQSWDEFLSVCEKIKEAGKIPVYYSGKDAWSLQILPAISQDHEASLYKPGELNTLIMTNKLKNTEREIFIDGLAKAKELKDKGYVNKTYLSDTYDDAQRAIAEGEAAIYFMGTWVTGEFNSKYPGKLDDIGAFALPIYNKVGFYYPTCIMLTTGCEDIELARQAINYVESVEVQQIFFDAEPGIPSINGVEVNLAACDKEAYALFSEGKVIMPYETNPDITQYNSGDYSKYIQDVLVEAKTPMDVTEAMDAEIAKQAEAKGDSNWN